MLKYLLLPFSILYGTITSVRNYVYDRGLKPAAGFDLPVISVGNLTVGGTGKTPMVEYLIRLLKPQWKVATLSRGYGRETKGFRIAGATDTAAAVGDEPYQIYSKFAPEVTVAVGEERALAIPLILQEAEADVILLDDAFQHRRVRPSFSILLSDYNRPFYKDFVLPAGRLRESRSGAARADVVVVTKCPADLSPADQQLIESGIRRYTDKPVFFATLDYAEPVPFGQIAPAGVTRKSDVVLVTGIADPGPLLNYIASQYNVTRHFRFADHHPYTVSDLEKVAAAGGMVITTEKDMVKLKTAEFESMLSRNSWYYLPVAVRFLNGGAAFDQMVRAHVTAADQKN